MTAIEYNRNAEALCNLVNNRRAQVGREVLRTAHIMRAVKLVLGAPPAHRWDSEYYRSKNGLECPEKVKAWKERWEREFSHRWRKTPVGLVPA